MSQLETIDPIDTALEKFSPVRNEIARLAQENASLVFQYDTREGNRSARSHIAKLRGKRSDVERVRVAEKAYHLAAGRKVDAAARELDGELVKMIEVHDAPIRAIEEAEAAKIAAEQKRIEDERIAKEAAEKAAQEKALADAQAKADAAEREVAAMRQREHEEKIRREAEDKAKMEAAEKLKQAEQAKIDAERRAIERERQALIDTKNAAEQAERDKAAAVQRATEEAERKQREAQAAAQAKAKQQADAEAARLKNEKVRQTIIGDMAAILAATVDVGDGEIDRYTAEIIAMAILDGKIPNVTYRAN